jgi:hypothetical protein
MRKVAVAASLGAGYMLGSRAGRGPYERVQTKVRQFVGRQDLNAVATDLGDAVQDRATATAEKVAAKFQESDPEGSGGSTTIIVAEGF